MTRRAPGEPLGATAGDGGQLAGGVLLVGPDGALRAALMHRLRADGATVSVIDRVAAAPPADLAPRALVIWMAPPPPQATTALSLEGFVETLDIALAGTASLVKAVMLGQPALADRRLVLIADWAVAGLAGQVAGAASSGMMLGLARSWSLELGAEGLTVNAVICGPPAATGAPLPIETGVAHAVAFFLDRRAGAISGQVLSVCGGRTPGLLPF